ncbi:uncharacterized protein LOC111712035 [Eurytemora carolleeae]|uniref:uncharacterized protein LOC111712035 n=1 Tax=Eurytemora carolleeae TaxID=1294199 RepID=UPI000C781801|nr:uncharacterized protein LOC111712035 [Eurytemora carolleeae]|eukprot:XP_023342312.1 uncharacterized protein LOC111712035 [Eurytemora affinis]
MKTSCITKDWYTWPACYIPYIFLIVMTLHLVLLFYILFKLRQRVRVKLLQDLNENPKYEKIQQEVEQHMDHHMSRLNSLSGMIEYEKLRSEYDPDWPCEQKETIPEEKIADIYESILKTVNPKTELDKEYQFRAMRSKLKASLILHPYDLRGSRRCKIAETILNSVKNNMINKTDLEKRKRGCIPAVSRKMRHPFWLYTKVLLYVFIVSIGLWFYDVYTDAWVLKIWLELMCQLDVNARFCPRFIRRWLFNDTNYAMGQLQNSPTESYQHESHENMTIDEKKADYLVSILGLHNINYITFFTVSLIISIIR